MSEPKEPSIHNRQATEPSDEFESPNPSEVTKNPQPPTDEFSTHERMQKLHESNKEQRSESG